LTRRARAWPLLCFTSLDGLDHRRWSMIETESKPERHVPELAQNDLDALEEGLRQRKARLVDDILGLEREADEAAESSLLLSDQWAARMDKDLRIGCRESAAEEIDEISDALERLRDGTYGVCEICGDPIAILRLRAIPYARLCKTCQSAQEAS